MDDEAIKKYQGENAEEIPEVEEAINNPPKEEGTNTEGWEQSKGMMTLDTIPDDARQALPEEAQHLFVAAYNSIVENNGDREAAMKVAWDTLDRNENYVRGEDGKYRLTPIEQGLSNPQPLSAS